MQQNVSALAIGDPIWDLVPVLRAVEFRFKGILAPEARSVRLSPSFTQWDGGMCMMRKGPEGDWTVVLLLPRGIYPYLFYVDGVWWNDPDDNGRAPSSWGRDYSLKVVA